MELGSAIKFARESANLTTKELARRAGELAPSTISLIESGDRNPSLKVAKAIAKALDIPLWALMRLAEGETDASDRMQDIRRKLVKARMIITHQSITTSAQQEMHCFSTE